MMTRGPDDGNRIFNHARDNGFAGLNCAANSQSSTCVGVVIVVHRVSRQTQVMQEDGVRI